jgi:hypothetical protein
MDLISEIRFKRMIRQIQVDLIEQEFGPLSRYALANSDQHIFKSSDLEEKKSFLIFFRYVWFHRLRIILTGLVILTLFILWMSWVYNLLWLENSVHWIYLNWVYDSLTMEYP